MKKKVKFDINKAFFKKGETEFIVERNLKEETLLVSSDDDRSEESLNNENILKFHEILVFLIKCVKILLKNIQLIKFTLRFKF